MIIQNSKGLFGSKIAIIKNHAEEFFTISTAKESLMDGLSTMIMEGKYPTMRPCVKIIYTKSLKKTDRQGLHDVITETIDNILSEENASLFNAVNAIGEEYKKRGVIAELINVAQKDDEKIVFNENDFSSTNDLINAISTNPAHAFKAHEEELKKYFDKSPKEGTDKMVSVYFEYLYFNFSLLDRCAFNALGSERRSKLLNFLGVPIAKAAAEKYFEGDCSEAALKILANDDEAQKEYSQFENIFPEGSINSGNSMSAALTGRVCKILDLPKTLGNISCITGIGMLIENQRDADLSVLIVKSAEELGI